MTAGCLEVAGSVGLGQDVKDTAATIAIRATRRMMNKTDNTHSKVVVRLSVWSSSGGSAKCGW